VAAQNFEYKMSCILDKPTESLFGYISVLVCFPLTHNYLGVDLPSSRAHFLPIGRCMASLPRLHSDTSRAGILLSRMTNKAKVLLRHISRERLCTDETRIFSLQICVRLASRS
jgi:hypothetical protein